MTRGDAMIDIQELYSDLCMCGVFHGVLKKPLFAAFFKFCEETEIRARFRAYSDFVAEIYESGGSLTKLVTRLVFEDENVFVRKTAKGEKAGSSVTLATERELFLLGKFASLVPDDFSRELGTSVAMSFESEKFDIEKVYRERLLEIGKYGYGIFTSHPMFRLTDTKEIVPIVSADKMRLDGFVGYAEERQRIISNTERFISGRPAANTLLYGDAGTGKSSTVKAIVNEYFDSGLRLIELRKDQLCELPFVMGRVSENPLKFIIFIDDLSFNQNDDSFSMLKAVLEGSASVKADNALIYATSNRRHIVKESFADRDGDDVHINDTLQETLSLSERFGLTVMFSKPDRRLYLEIVHSLAEKKGISIPAEELELRAEAFALRRGTRSARCAEQFTDSLS